MSRTTDICRDKYPWLVSTTLGKMSLGISISCGHLPDFVHWGSLIQFGVSRLRMGGWIESDDHVHSVIELRKSNRYALRAPVLVEWAPQNGEPQSGQGVTRDINTFGVYIVTETLPPVGALVQMDILLPKLE